MSVEEVISNAVSDEIYYEMFFCSCIEDDSCDLLHSDEATLASLQNLSRFRLIQSDNQQLVVEMQPPMQAVSSALGPRNSESASELSKPLTVTVTFANTNQTSQSITGVQVNFCHMLSISKGAVLHWSTGGVLISIS